MYGNSYWNRLDAKGSFDKTKNLVKLNLKKAKTDADIKVKVTKGAFVLRQCDIRGHCGGFYFFHPNALLSQKNLCSHGKIIE